MPHNKYKQVDWDISDEEEILRGEVAKKNVPLSDK